MPRCPSPSHAIIDLSAIAANLAVVRKRAGDRKVLFAVKADAYGHGAVEVSRYVEKHRYADWLAVATVIAHAPAASWASKFSGLPKSQTGKLLINTTS